MRSYQRTPYVAKMGGCKRFVEKLHRRAGKDRKWMNITFLSMVERVGNYIHVFPALNMGRRDIWDNVIQERRDGIEHSLKMIDMFPPEFIRPGGKNEAEMQIELINGSTWQIMGADDEAAIERARGLNAIGIVLSEYAFMNPKVWKVLQPVLLENDGWIAFISTPKMEDDDFDKLCHFAEIEMAQSLLVNDAPTWFYQCLTVEDTKRDAEGEDGTPVITQEKLNEIRKEPGTREEEVQREYYCNTRGYRHGTIYGDLYTAAEQQKRIGGRVPFIVNLPVGICMDLGTSDMMVMWFYQTPDPYRVHFIDYYQDTLKDLPFFDNVIRGKPYTIGRICLPHDGAYASSYFFLRGYKNTAVALRPRYLWTALVELRAMWPQFYFDSVLCAQGLEGLKNYKRKWDPVKMIYIDEPVHDQWSHSADGIRSGVACGFGPLEWIPDSAKGVKVETDFDPRSIGVGMNDPFVGGMRR